eukprot:735424_1
MNRSLCNALALVLLAFSLSYWMIHHQTNPGMIETIAPASTAAILALIVTCVAVAALNLHRSAATAGIDPATVAKCKPIDAVKALMTTTTTSKYIRPKQTSKQRRIRISGRDLLNRTRNTDGWPIAQTPLIHRTIRIHTQIQMHRQPECGHTTSNSNPTNDRQKSPNPQTQTTITAQQVNVEPWTIHSGDNPKTGMTGTKSSHASVAKTGVTGQKSLLASVAKNRFDRTKVTP